ncbi:MAG: metal ABC transporter permease [Candidatus Zixiibacteriota bacterium]
MSDWLTFLFWPFVACVVLVSIHIYFGMHIIRRGIIFVDLSLAQVAAMGSTMALLLGHEHDSSSAYMFSLSFSLLGAALFTATRELERKVPQEAIIGIVYAVSAAASILMVSRSPEGAEHIRHLLVGSVLTVTPETVWRTAAIYTVVGAFHWFARRPFLRLTFSESGPPASARLWDFLFYASFALVITLAVKIAGVLLVFIFLVVPAVIAAILSDSIQARLIVGWVVGLIGSLLGLAASVWLDTPTGATIVCTFGLILALFALVRLARR